MKKGDPLQAARLAGIMAAKQTSSLIPSCHPLPISSVHVELTPTARGYDIEARVRTRAQTGVEMEALTAVAVAALTIYDMVKAVDKGDGHRQHPARLQERGQVGYLSGPMTLATVDKVRYFRQILELHRHEHPRRPSFSEGPAWTLPRSFIDRLRREFPQHTFVDAWDEETLRRHLPDVDVAFSAAIDRSAFRSLPRLRWVQSPAVGVGGMLGPELVASPVVLTSARGVRARAIAEHVLGVTIALARQLPLVLRRQAAHEWALNEIETSGRVRTLRGCRMAIVGLGAIGLEVATLAAAFGLRVSAIRKRLDQPIPASVEEVSAPDRLLDLLARTDVVVLCAPQTAETRKLIGAAGAGSHQARSASDQRRPRQARGRRGRRRGACRTAASAALRSTCSPREPLDPASPYWDLPNVIVTPHTSGAMEDYWTPLVGAVRREPQALRSRSAAAERRRQAGGVLTAVRRSSSDGQTSGAEGPAHGRRLRACRAEAKRSRGERISARTRWRWGPSATGKMLTDIRPCDCAVLV